MTHEPELLSRYLDGEIAADQLPADVRAEAERFERIVAALERTPSRLPPGVKEAVMRRVRQERRGRWRTLLAWAIEPVTVRVRPLAGALAAAAAIALLLLGTPLWRGGDGSRDGIATRFVYVAPQATQIAVTGDFAGWDPAGIPLERQAGGVWVAEIELTPGLHHYVFVVDGTEWQPDPNAVSRVDDGFGRENSVLLVAPRTTSSS